ncbi:MAG: cation:proton antiporter [Sphingomonadales bacterium]|nr:cation:proton antiporter [Sphingomonadales bacterium]
MHGGFESTGLSDALVILGAAGLVIPLFARFRITPIIGFILVGVLAGPAGLGSLTDRAPWLYYVTITEPEAVEPFAELGIILLLFSIGLELSVKRLWAMRGVVFGIGAAELLISGFIIAGALFALNQGAIGALGLGLALALSSTALVLPISGTKSAVGRAALGMLLFEDVAIVPIIFFLGAMGPAAANGGFAGLSQTLLFGVATVAAMVVGGRYLLPRIFAQAARTKSSEVFLAVSLLTVILASLATTAVGLSPIVGALVAGLLLAETEYRSEVEVITAPFTGLALGVFLITVGMSLDLRLILENWVSLTLAVVGVIAVKTCVTALLLRMSGARQATAIESGLLMASPSETTLIVLAAALAAQLIQPSTAAFWQTVTAIGLTITPLLAKAGRAVALRVEMREYKIELPEELEIEDRAIVVGLGRVGRLVADMLTRHDQPFVAIDSDIDTVAHGRREGIPTIYGDVSHADFLAHLDMEQASALILTMDDPVALVNLTRRARAAYPELTIIARARDPDHAAALYRAGATDAVPETVESSQREELRKAILADSGGVERRPVLVPKRLRDIEG